MKKQTNKKLNLIGYVKSGAAYDDILIHTRCLLLQLQVVVMCMQCRDELTVVKLLPEGAFAV